VGGALTITRGFDGFGRLAGISNTYAASQVVGAFTYAYNNLNQRTRMTREDDTFWDYAYYPLGQLINATRHLPPAEPLSGYQFAYAHDNIGNRLTSTANGQTSTYTPDNDKLSQYASRTVPGVVDLLGSADPAAHVTVNNQPTARQGIYWHAQMSAGSVFNIRFR
jgi:hypothetical protein